MSDLHDDFERAEIARKSRDYWIPKMRELFGEHWALKLTGHGIEWPKPETPAQPAPSSRACPCGEHHLTDFDRALLAESGIKAEE